MNICIWFLITYCVNELFAIATKKTVFFPTLAEDTQRFAHICNKNTAWDYLNIVSFLKLTIVFFTKEKLIFSLRYVILWANIFTFPVSSGVLYCRLSLDKKEHESVFSGIPGLVIRVQIHQSAGAVLPKDFMPVRFISDCKLAAGVNVSEPAVGPMTRLSAGIKTVKPSLHIN